MNFCGVLDVEMWARISNRPSCLNIHYLLHCQKNSILESRFLKWYISDQITLRINCVEKFEHSYIEIMKLQVTEAFLKSKYRVSVLQNRICYPRPKKTSKPHLYVPCETTSTKFSSIKSKYRVCVLQNKLSLFCISKHDYPAR